MIHSQYRFRAVFVVFCSRLSCEVANAKQYSEAQIVCAQSLHVEVKVKVMAPVPSFREKSVATPLLTISMRAFVHQPKLQNQ